MNDDDACAMLALRNQLVFPGCRAVLPVMRPASLRLLEALEGAPEPLVALFLQRDVGTQEPAHHDMHEVGVLARIVAARHHEGLGVELSVEALRRVRRVALVRSEPYLVASITSAEAADDSALDAHTLQQAEALRTLAAQWLPDTPTLERVDPADPTEARAAISRFTDRVAAALDAPVDERAPLLHTPDLARRVQATLTLLQRQAEWQTAAAALELPTVDMLQDLWPFRAGADERIARDLASGALSASEAAQLEQLREHGYVVWERLIAPELIERMLREVADVASQPGRFLLTDHRRGRAFRASGPDFDSFENVLDTHVNLGSARELAFHPTILRFLTIVFDERPMATQQLLFQRSNEHPLHQDTAYVCLREPLKMLATWIALEDVVPGRGELTYYAGSHRLPHYRFTGDSKRFQPGLDDEDAARAELLRRCAEHGCEKRDFLAKRGDVFLWAADLLHGSNARTRPPEETRQSLVTHYCPESNEPLYFHRGPWHRCVQPYGAHALMASSHYRLPVTRPPAQPDFPLPEPC